jgi:hypothetical protein
VTAIVAVILIETVIVHLVVRHWSVRTAWVLTAVSILGAIQIVIYYRRRHARDRS